MSSGALREAWESAQKPGGGSSLRAAWEAAQNGGAPVSETTKRIRDEQKKGLLAGRMTRENTNEREAVEAEEITPREAVGGTLANLIRDVPGGEALTAGVHSVVHNQSYPESFQAVRGAEESIPAVVRYPARMAGATAAFGKIPGSNTTKGALLGALDGFSDADPEADREAETMIGGAMGGALGFGGELVGAGASRAGKFLKGRLAKEKETAGAIAKWFKGKPAPATAPVTAPAPPAAPPAATPAPAPAPTRAPRTPRTAAPRTPTMSLYDQIVAPRGMTLDETLQALVGKMRASQPGEIGNVIGDAELAMQPPAQPDLEDLLRRSLAAPKKVRPSP